MSIVKSLYEKGLINPPEYIKDSIEYLSYVGSNAYGVSNNNSDFDCYGWCIPRRIILFPYETGYIDGFGQKPEHFEQYQQHHIYDEDNKQEYDLTIYNIVKYFQLCMENNPNMVDSLFVPQRCVLSMSPIGQIVRENRHIFLHLGSFHKFKGYSYSQMSKMREKHVGAKRLFEFEKEHKLDALEVKDHKELMGLIELYANINYERLCFIDDSKTKTYATEQSLINAIDNTSANNVKDVINNWFRINDKMRISADNDEKVYSFVDLYKLNYEAHAELTKKGKLKLKVENVTCFDKLHVKELFDQRLNNYVSIFNKLSRESLYKYYELLAQFGFFSTKRMETVRKYGMDVKFAYHIIRLVGEVEQIMREGDLTLDRKDRREHMKAIRNGEWTFEQIADWFDSKEKELQLLYNNCKIIPYSPRFDEIRRLLRKCLEMKFGDLSKTIGGNEKSIDLFISKLEKVIHDFK